VSKFTAIFLLEGKRFYAKKKLIFLVFSFILLTIFAYLGINQYNRTMDKTGEFREVEHKMFANLKTYDQISINGARLKFVPSSTVVLFHNTGISSETTARINPVFTLDIFNNLKGKGIADHNYIVSWDYAGIFLILGSLYALFLGSEVTGSKEYLKFLSTQLESKNIILHLSISRSLLLVLTYVFMFVLHLLFIQMMGIEFSHGDWTGIFIYMCVSMVLLVFFLFLGVFWGFNRSPVKVFTALFLSWFILIFILPGALNMLVWEGFDTKHSQYQNELNKLSKAVDFERWAKEKEGDFDRNNILGARNVVDYYIKDYYPRISTLEHEFKLNLESTIRRESRISIFFATTYYSLVISDVSSRGPGNFLRFYHYAEQVQENFVYFWIDRVFYCDYTKMVPFIRGDENIYQGKSIVTPYFLPGFFIHGFYILLLGLGCLIRCRRFLYTYDDNKTPFKNKKPLSVTNNVINPYYTSRTGLRDYLYNLLSGASLKTGPKEQNLKVVLDGKELPWGKKTNGFIYICQASGFPGDIKGRDFALFVLRINHVSPQEKSLLLEKIPSELLVKNFNRMTDEEQVQILLEVLPYIKAKVFLLYHTCKGLTLDHYIFFKKQLQRLINTGATIIYLSPGTNVNEIQKERCLDILELPYWVKQLETLEEIN
jgi:hypothetical protein